MKSVNQNKHSLIYKRILNLFYDSHSGHIGSALSCLDILIKVHTEVMLKGDKFILSKGHAAPALYVVLNYLKKISDKELLTFHNNSTKLAAHPSSYNFESDIPFSTGSLGHGLSLASGIAHSYKYFYKNKNKVYCLISDGECNEGQIWEAAQYATSLKLSNLIILVDKNGLQAFGKTKEVLGDSASADKWKSFGFETYEADGHSAKSLDSVFEEVKRSNTEKPKIIIFKTIKGHGVSFMENKLEWHYLPLNDDLYKKALIDVQKLYEK